jgi:hypothetical protein
MNETRPHGSLRGFVIPAPIPRQAITTVDDAIAFGSPRKPLLGQRFGKTALMNRLAWQEANAENFERSLAAQQAMEDAKRGGAMAAVGHLWLAKIDRKGRQWDLGLAGCRVVTTTGVNFIVDAFQGLVEPEVMKFHGVGTGGAAEAVGNTALTTELTTQYQVASTRPTGSLGELAGNANVFESSATITVSATVALTEHGLFSQAAIGGGVMLDRTLFSVVNLASGESLQAQYDLTIAAGG